MADLTNLKNELKVIGKVGDCLRAGQFSGSWCQDAAISQMYVQGLYKTLEAEIKRQEAAPAPVVDSAVPEVVK